MSQITIIQNDNCVGVDGVFRQVDLSNLDYSISAIQFNTTSCVGHIEYDLVNGVKPQNTTIHSISDYQWVIDAWELAAPPAPEPPGPPSVVTMRQARLALLQGGYLSTVNAAINAGGEADKITWEYATEVNRADPLVANMAIALNLSSNDLDNLFTLAASL